MVLSMWSLAVPALALRPTQGGQFSFSREDVIATYDPPDDPRIRITYSAEGPNKARGADFDESGVPDYVEDAAEVAILALDLFEASGFRPPLYEADVGLGELGGSPALDVYLLDFNRQADGHYGIDNCVEDPLLRCGGYLVVENDFLGYSYPSAREALEVVVPHELFHGVQHAYTSALPVWITEGTAVWAERLFDEDSDDFVRFANAYLEDVTRSLDNPPIGPAPGFAYGTGLWFDFLTLRHDNALMVELFDDWATVEIADEGDAALATEVMIDALAGRGDTIEDAWARFATFNLATGTRAGEIEGYPYADRLIPVVSEQAGAIDDDNRFYPLATTYYRVNHRGGELWFGLEAAAPELMFALHATTDGGALSPVVEPSVVFDGADPAARSLGDLPAGIYWLWGAQPRAADDSVKVRLCVGGQADVTECFGVAGTDPVDTGGGDEDPRGCGCSAGGAGSGGGLLLAGLLVAVRRGARTARG